MEGWTNALAIIGGGLSDYEVETGEYTPTSNIARPTISFANTHSTTPFFVGMWMHSQNTLTDNSRNYVFVFFDFYRYSGGDYVPGSPSSTTTLHYAKAYYSYTGSNGSVSNSTANITHNSDDTGSSSSAYSRYWVTESDFKPSSASTSRYWGNGKTFKWIAIWKKST